jgi:hypothetical protein
MTAENLRGMRDALFVAFFWLVIGICLGWWLHSDGRGQRPEPDPPLSPPSPVHVAPPVPAPAPPPPPAPAKHDGHLTISYIEPLYTSPEAAALRDTLARFDWRAHGGTFRSYTDGEDDLTRLGFAGLYKPADLPIVYVQETLPDGKAPIIAGPIKSPTLDQLRSILRGLRGK